MAGAEMVYDHRDENYMMEIKKAYPEGFEVCLDMLASSNLGFDVTVMAFGGRIAVVGSRGSVQINPRNIMQRELEIYGVHVNAATPEELRRYASYMYAVLRDNMVTPIVTLEVPLDQAPLAHQELINRQSSTVGNIVLVP